MQQADYSPLGAFGASFSPLEPSEPSIAYSQGVGAPCGNTGQSSASVVLDYLRFTIPAAIVGDDCSCYSVLELLGLDVLPLVVDTRRGGHAGWSSSATIAPGGIIAWGGVSQRGTVGVDLPGGALGYLAALGLDVFAWISYLLDLGVRVVRLDIALDDRLGLVTYERVAEGLAAGAVTHSRRSSIRCNYCPYGRGWTWYVGRPGSSAMVRIYDKAAEQLLPEGVHWVRVEAQLGQDRAHRIAWAWRARDYSASAAVGIVRGILDFRVDDGTATKSRWALRPWWDTFTRAADVVRVRVAKVARTMADVTAWLYRAVASALAAVQTAYGVEAVSALVADGGRRMSASHRRLVQLGTVGTST